MAEYRFKEKGHRHELLVGDEWKPLTGITTVLGVIAKPQLIQWAANMAVEHIANNLQGIINGILLPDFILAEARIAHTKYKKEAGQKGTDIHALLEIKIKEAIKEGDGLMTGHDPEEAKQVSEFINWAITNKVKFLESELHLYSEKYFLGGICDFVCEIDGEQWIGDIKTGGVYPEAFFQMAGYQVLMEEMGIYPKIKGYIVIGLKNGLEDKRSISNEDNRTAFLSALSIYRIKQKVESQIL